MTTPIDEGERIAAASFVHAEKVRLIREWMRTYDEQRGITRPKTITDIATAAAEFDRATAEIEAKAVATYLNMAWDEGHTPTTEEPTMTTAHTGAALRTEYHRASLDAHAKWVALVSAMHDTAQASNRRDILSVEYTDLRLIQLRAEAALAKYDAFHPNEVPK